MTFDNSRPSVAWRLTVLDEIDGRLGVLEAIANLAADPNVDELHSLHPLVTQARWVFGPEFDSSEYTANVTLSTAMRALLSKRAVPGDFVNERRRPDLIVLADGTLSALPPEVTSGCRELQKGWESIISPVQPASRRLPQASDLLDSIMVPHRTRVIRGCRQMGSHIPPVPPPAVVHRTENVKRRQRAVDETCQRVQLRRFARLGSHQHRFVPSTNHDDV